MDAALTQNLIQNLTRILRYSITDLEKETTICQDLKIIEDYLIIHKIRFEHFSYNIVCPETIDNQAILNFFASSSRKCYKNMGCSTVLIFILISTLPWKRFSDFFGQG